ncbi:sulfotransferase [Rubrobacter xylanophilus DSM 9941]|uniref:Sulfotransferase n=1 Tax=Rubrobacter xylanophilus (strain DSM 9941 / JCM 11954 / NBRC 16129 / PRD-1) TaxID=266117 RepID=Q1AY36_RUBXD|nr:sulfotransferase [Rubrobacter xylanophilus]ABG03692.1 sulfotransferase [Rubrobacter xylanophilus DSM 9941]
MGSLPNLIVIGAMKCGTTALHRYLGLHPEVYMSSPKELNFFFGEAGAGGGWHRGNWHRGVGWYASRFDPSAPVRGESSPGYTSPDHPEAAERMARLLPEARLVYLVRDPVGRAVSQYLHHRTEGTERRGMREALLDPGSQYLERSRYLARLSSYLERFPRRNILVLWQEELLGRRREALRRVFRFAGADDSFWTPEYEAPPPGRGAPRCDPGLRREFLAALGEDLPRRFAARPCG